MNRPLLCMRGKSLIKQYLVDSLDSGSTDLSVELCLFGRGEIPAGHAGPAAPIVRSRRRTSLVIPGRTSLFNLQSYNIN